MEIIQYCSLVRTLDRDTVLRFAATKWAEIASFQPELAASAVLQRRILTIVLDAAETLGDAPLFVLTPKSIVAKWDRGLPALYNEPITLPPRLKDALRPLCTVLAEGGAGDSALHIRDALATGSIDADSLLRVSLARNPAAMRTSALHMGFSPDLLWLIGELGSSPLAHRLASTIDDGRSTMDDGRPTIDDHWDRGYCPCCGSWPVLIEATADLHTLRCSYCTLGWHLDLDAARTAATPANNSSSPLQTWSVLNELSSSAARAEAIPRSFASKRPRRFLCWRLRISRRWTWTAARWSAGTGGLRCSTCQRLKLFDRVRSG